MSQDFLNNPFSNDCIDFSKGFSFRDTSEYGLDNEKIYFFNNNSEKNTNELTGEEKSNKKCPKIKQRK